MKGFIPFIFFLIILNFVFKKLRKFIYAQNQKDRIRALKIADIDHLDGIDFEYYIGNLLSHQGYKVKITPGSNDFGVDIIARYRMYKYAIQIKRYMRQVSRRAVSDAVAGKVYYKCDKAMVVTNSYFSESAIKFAKSLGCELIDRDILADWIMKFQRY